MNFNEHFKHSKSVLFVSQLASDSACKMSTIHISPAHSDTNVKSIAPLVTHSPRSTTTVLRLDRGCMQNKTFAKHLQKCFSVLFYM